MVNVWGENCFGNSFNSRYVDMAENSVMDWRDYRDVYDELHSVFERSFINI